jgi:purine-nucleoside phosphorylase
MNPTVLEHAEEAAAFLRQRIAEAAQSIPKIALVLGSGLGAFAEQVKNSLTLPYAEIPHFPQSTVLGHAGRLIVGSMNGVQVAVMQGRVHAYEGYNSDEVVFPVRVLGRLGARQIVLTNAAGSLRPEFPPGNFVALNDHINLTGTNPCIGPNEERLGPRFFDMTHAYSPRLRELAQRTAAEQGWQMHKGVYLGVLGPSFETPAEIRFFRTAGADLVGMSTVQEVIAARHMGLEVLTISCVTNLAAGIGEGKLSHAEVIETGDRVSQRLTKLLMTLLPRMAALPEESVESTS